MLRKVERTPLTRTRVPGWRVEISISLRSVEVRCIVFLGGWRVPGAVMENADHGVWSVLVSVIGWPVNIFLSTSSAASVLLALGFCSAFCCAVTSIVAPLLSSSVRIVRW